MSRLSKNAKKITAFNLQQDYKLSNKYTVIRKIGGGWEGEVYLVMETLTGIERAAKIFFPHRNQNNKNLKLYATKLHKLRECSVLIQYITQDEFFYNSQRITYLVSELVEGVSLSKYVESRKGKRLSLFEALNLLHTLVGGVEEIHQLGEYHGDLHTDNIIVQRVGTHFDLKMIDMFHYGRSTKIHYQDDICFLMRVFHEVIGGNKYYKDQPQVVKDLCCGLKNSLIKKKFKTAEQLRRYMQNINLLEM